MIPRCLSKTLAEMSEEALRRGEKPSLSERSKCYSCSGENLHCEFYSNPSVREEDKKRLLHELIHGTGRYVLESKEDNNGGE
jgi:hypothetical protein